MFLLRNQISSKSVSQFNCYKTIFGLVIIYGYEIWSLGTNEEEVHRRWEQEVLRRTFKPENGRIK